MKFIPSILLFCPLISAKPDTTPQPLGSQNRKECIDPDFFDASRDYFPKKVSPKESKFWDIQYFNSYKILRNELAGETFVLYQCGTELPADFDTSNYTHVLPVPLPDGVALSSTTHIPHFELLGLRNEIKAWLGDPTYITSPCFNKMIDDGDVTVVLDTRNQTVMDDFAASVGPDLVSFHNFRGSYNSTLQNSTLSASAEASNEATFEWNKFIAVFFNAEHEANCLFDESSERYQCATDEAAQLVTADAPKPTVLWASYTNYTGVDGWSVAKCPNYYCEYAEHCSANIIESRDGTIEYFGSTLFTTEDFVELAKEADHWIYSSPNWNEAYGIYGAQLDDFVSVKGKQVFDTEGNGPNSWFEQRLAEYDAVLQDFCDVVGTSDGLHQRVWLRNVFTEPVGNQSDQCANVNAPLQPRASPCGQEAPTTAPVDSGASHVGLALIYLVAGFVASSLL